jgi:four helix bundle protein
METQEPQQFNQQMRERTQTMSVGIHDLLSSKKITQFSRPVINQLIRSSSSVAANFRSATRGRSDAKFYAKICIVAEECDETQFWLDYLIRIKVLVDSETNVLRDEVEQLVKIFSSMKKKMKDRLKANSKIVKWQDGKTILPFCFLPFYNLNHLQMQK